MGFLTAGVRAKLEGVPAIGRQAGPAFLTALRLDGMARLAATGTQSQTQALEYVPATGALRVLAARAELALVGERIIQPRRLVPSDDRRRVECALGRAADLDNP